MPPLTEEQIKAIKSIDKHVLVSAGAGSGKTFVLIERYIQVLAADMHASINDIIAVTYTRKAAEEMRSRLKARLKELAATNESATEIETATEIASATESASVTESVSTKRQRWLKCLSEVETARIGTIHSLCESILKNYSSEAGIDPGFEILNDLERAELLAESIDQCLHLVIEKPLEYFGELLDYPIESLRQWLSDFLRSPLKYKESRKKFADCSLESMELVAERVIKEDIQRTLNDILFNRKFMIEYHYLKDNVWHDSQGKLAVIQNEMLSYLNVLVDSHTYGFAERFQALQRLGSMESARTTGGAAAKELRQCMSSLRKEAQSVASRHSSELNQADKQAFVLLRALIMLTDDALSRYELLKQSHQKLDFDDLIERCQILLSSESTKTQLSGTALSKFRNSGFALKQISKNLRAVLVDEFQDTNWAQAKLLTALASAHARLFLIGDDKQSIYKFQGADVGTFNTCKTYISSITANSDSAWASSAREFGLPLISGHGEEMTLSQSFRSHPQIVNFVNHVFRTLFHTEPDAEEFRSRFQALRPARSSDDGDPLPRIDITYTAPTDEEDPELKPDLEIIEAQLTANWIITKVENENAIFDKTLNCHRPISYSDFAILLQANSDFAIIERALSERGVPYVSLAGSGFLDRQEILDLENLLKWLISPQDSHALFAVLRSPLFGFSDDLLHNLKAGKKNSLWQCLSQQANDNGQEDLQKARQVLQNLHYESGRLALPDLIRKIVLVSGYDIILLSTAEGKQKSRNIFKFLALANQHRNMDISEFLKSLRSMRELGVKNLTDAPLSADNAVKIMTIHKSKGLEFGAVALPRLGRSVHQKPDKLFFGKELGIALDCTRDADEEKPAFFVATNNLSRRMDEEEKKRLLYVALTRARDYLGLFVTPRQKRSINFTGWLIEALSLPEPDAEIETEVMTAGKIGERCSWNLVQKTINCSNGNKRAPLPALEPSSADRSQDFFMPESIRSDTKPELSAPKLLQLDPEDRRTDFSLLENDQPELVQTFTPVSWQALLRACPTDTLAGVHATIAGNYFHLLMNNLGPELQLPSEYNRRALLLNHEVAVHDLAQQELLLKDSERLLITFKNSSLYQLMKTAIRRIEESAYLIVSGACNEELRPDLIIEDKEGNWHVIDYKTDHFELPKLAKQVSLHRAQVARYVQDLNTLINVQAKAWIYFAQLGRLEPVDLSQPAQLSLF